MIKRERRKIYLEVDGGIDTETAALVVNAGANILVAGTAIIGQKDIPAAIREFKKSIRE